MAAVTTSYGGAKEWSWSYSKLKNFDQCPKRHYEIDIAKNFKDTSADDPNSPLVYGNRVHEAMSNRLTKGTPFVPEMVDYEPFIKRVEAKVLAFKGTLLVEQKYAITRQFGPTGYFAKNVWYRGIADVLILAPPVALVIDWKTGKIVEDSVQLALMAQCIFSFYPEILRVGSRFAWLKENAETDETFSRADMIKFWPGMITRVSNMEEASRTLTYPPTPGGLCKKYCPVVSCIYHGKGSPR